MIRSIVVSYLALSTLLVSYQAVAAEGGYSNYIPGFYGDIALAVEPGDGLSMRNDFYFYRADDNKTIRSGELNVDIDIALSYNYLSFVYKPGITLFGAQYVYGATITAGKMDIDATLATTAASARIKDDESDFGDLTLIPAAFYWNNGNHMHYSWSWYVVAPTASYDEDAIANTGLNYWTYETDIATTYLNQETGQDYSLVLGYGYNTENKDTNYQSGDEIHADYILNQFISESTAIGIHGFWYKQIGGDSGDGATLGDFKAESAGIGPAFMWIPPQYDGEVAFTLKWLHEYHAENRLRGDHIFLSFMASF